MAEDQQKANDAAQKEAQQRSEQAAQREREAQEKARLTSTCAMAGSTRHCILPEVKLLCMPDMTMLPEQVSLAPIPDSTRAVTVHVCGLLMTAQAWKSACIVMCQDDVQIHSKIQGNVRQRGQYACASR